ncbi:hypothetical protein L7D45_13075 [Brucella pseudogrignonensis]|uniref:hypothetical protein n=1 Tax=Brucella pseudogrignonensis TaxID=419475 RepID=UPI001EDB45E9|nr:hypothetical protein [Brucella pseudogrignonensis]UKK94690.1 hypothetical protein L7D45_13075 [Brucella pseudogrignonensis]
MHPLFVNLCGFALLAVFIAFGRLWHISTTLGEGVVPAFIALWLVISGVNLWIGISTAGYPLGEELRILPFVALPPILTAIALRLAF